MVSDPFLLIPYGSGFLALSREDFTKALILGRELLGVVETPSPGYPPDGELLDAEGASRKTGVPASWFLEAARQGRIPHIRAGKYVRFRLSDLTAVLEVRPVTQGQGSLGMLKKRVKQIG